jgi:hypothetical protein
VMFFVPLYMFYSIFNFRGNARAHTYNKIRTKQEAYVCMIQTIQRTWYVLE